MKDGLSGGKRRQIATQKTVFYIALCKLLIINILPTSRERLSAGICRDTVLHVGGCHVVVKFLVKRMARHGCGIAENYQFHARPRHCHVHSAQV